MKTDVSKSSSVGGLVIAGAETIRAPRADPELPLERALRDLEEVLEDRKPTLNPRVWGASLREADAADDEAVGAKVEKEVVAAAAIIV